MEKTLVDQDSCVFPFDGILQVNLHFVTQFMTYLMYHIYHFSDIKLFMIIMDIWNTSFFAEITKHYHFSGFVFHFACVYFPL